jgi:chondroitin AC lyase
MSKILFYNHPPADCRPFIRNKMGMKKTWNLILLLLILSSFMLKGQTISQEKRNGRIALDFQKEIRTAVLQYLTLKNQELKGDTLFPQTYNQELNKFVASDSKWWCSGFYPGTLFNLYEASGNQELYDEGLRMLELLKKEQFNTETHDIGFMMYCSYGNANRIASRPEFRQILINSAKSLCSRFNPVVGCIKSHNRQPEEFIVIIDNMMNLELLFAATKLTGDSSYYHIAVTHANTTMKNHFRPDNSAYHAINYNKNTGDILNYIRGQSYSIPSAWARGQAWALYGFTMMYRETKDKKYLQQAEKIANFILNHPNLPEDKIPYWDFNAPNIPDALRDASAGAINCSALLELCGYVDKSLSDTYLMAAEQMLYSLSSVKYKAEIGANGGFILKHSVGNMPSGKEVDAPLSYADYYYVEALKRCADIQSKKSMNILTNRLIDKHLNGLINSSSVRKNLQSMLADGSWSDIDYETITLYFSAGKHLDRLVEMAKAYRKPGNEYFESEILLDKIISGIDYFYRKNPQSTNWWHLEIGAPTDYMTILILLKGHIEKSLLLHYSDYLKDLTDNSAHKGGNRTWVSAVTIHKGCIEDNTDLILKGFESIASTINIASDKDVEGIKIDHSFHQHRPQLYSGGYGLAMAESIVEYIMLAQETDFQTAFTPEKIKLFSDLLLKGHQLFGYRKTFDFGAVGRGLSRKGGPHSISINALDGIKQIDPTNKDAYQAWIDHINGGPFPTTGNTYFWKSDIMTHHGENYYLSAIVISTRTNGTEMLNGENLKGYYLPLGATNILTSGEEYEDIFPVWDWNRIPGTTSVLNPSSADLRWYFFGSNAFAGGVSNSKSGVIAFENAYNGIKAKKTYFFTGDMMLCLGSGIQAVPTQAVVTSVNQCLLNGTVTINESGKINVFSDSIRSFKNLRWVHHDGVNYVFPSGGKITLKTANQTGSWKNIRENGSDELIAQGVFSLWFEHGRAPENEEYCYIVIPDKTLSEIAEISVNHGFIIVKNDTEIQAVQNKVQKIKAIVFYNPGKVEFENGFTVESDKKSLVLIQEKGKEYDISVSDPLHSASEINITLNNQNSIRFILPQDDFMGSTITKTIKR